MPFFSASSKEKLLTVHPDLQLVFLEVVKEVDCTVVSGLRTFKEQRILYSQGRTMPGPIVTNCDGFRKKSNHQSDTPIGNAVDVVPYPIDWNDRDRFYHFAGFARGVAWQLGVDLRWGGDWDSDYVLNDQSFYDFPHFERHII